MSRFAQAVLSAAALLSIAASVVTAAEPDGPAIAGRYRAVFASPPSHIPSDSSVDAPLMGNGDTLVALGGGPARLQFYINKNDLWVMRRQDGSHPCPLARLDVELPGLQGGSYHIEQDLLHSATAGRFTKGGATLTLDTAVAATENLLWARLTAAGGTFRGQATLALPGQGPASSSALGGGTGRIQLGREQYGGGRWYLDGALDEAAVYGRALSADEIRALAGKREVAAGLLRAWHFEGTAETGKINGASSFAEGVRGQALLLDGKSTYVDSEPLAPGKGVTVAAFVKVNRHAPDGHAQYILSQGEWSKDWSLGLSAGKLRMAVGGRFAQTAAPIPTGRWLHVAGTCGEGGIRVFVDGRDVTPEDTGDGANVAGASGDVPFVERRFAEGVMVPAGAACALRVLGGGREFVVEPGKPVWIVATVRSRFDAEDFRRAAVRRVAALGEADLAKLRTEHEAWWRRFWSQSFVEIPDKVLEQRYYLSHYVLASASRVPDFPPGLFGWVTTDRPAWNGDYHTNYNHVAPFYGLYAANHLEQADPCHGPFLAALEVGHAWSLQHAGVKGGVLLPVGLGPKGSIAGAALLDQKSNSAYSCVPLASRWVATYDLDFGREAYPFVRDTATFWEQWLKFENDRYVITKDAIHEGSGADVNAILSLGLVRLVMGLALDMSQELGVDAARREKWVHVRDHLSDYPTCTVRDLPQRFWPKHLPQTDETLALPIFRYSEKGTPWWPDNTLGIQHIYPAGGLGLDSPPELLRRAHNQIRVLNRWVDFNGMNSFYAAAARVGYDPAVILREMRAMLDKLALPNGMIRGNPHGMEHQSIVPNAIQEMLVQSHEGVLRLFPCWPRELDARFGTLRARGAFLVSAELAGGTVRGVRILSEKGRDCTLVNPWPGKPVRVLRNGQPAEAATGDRFTLKAAAGETLELKPAGE